MAEVRRIRKDTETGCVFLVGAGPGDPGLLTLRGMDCLRRAEVVVYDHLVNERLLEHVPSEAETIYAGKEGGRHALEQEEITSLLLDRAGRGRRVVRLKGGDPFLFGRGGEEAEALAAAKIPFEIVPGVTSATAVPAYAGIPLTHRQFASSVAFVTGHEDATRRSSRIAWEKIATGVDTLVFLMGYGQLSAITGRLVKEGRDAETPVALIRWGTLPVQSTLVGTLGDIARRAAEARFGPPAIVVVGEVVGLRSVLDWFERRPLFGKAVLVTRAREQAGVLVQLLEAQGAHTISFPVIEIRPPDDYRRLDRAIGRLDAYDWILFTSVHGVSHFWQRMRAAGKDARALKAVRLGAIGTATAAELSKHGLEADLVPSEFRGEALLEAMTEEDLQGKRILIPRAAEARDVLPAGLRRLGARVTLIEAYRTERPAGDFDRIRAALERGEIDVVTFTSSSTVRHFVEGLGGRGVRLLKRGTLLASIGPITSSTLGDYGLTAAIQPAEYTVPSLVQSLCQYFARPGGSS